jgi:hypothetical protein
LPYIEPVARVAGELVRREFSASKLAGYTRNHHDDHDTS